MKPAVVHTANILLDKPLFRGNPRLRVALATLALLIGELARFGIERALSAGINGL